MTVKTFREFDNYFYISMIILAGLSVRNRKFLCFFPPLIIGVGINYCLCSYYKLIKITESIILRLALGFLGVFFILIGSIFFIYEIFLLIKFLF